MFDAATYGNALHQHGLTGPDPFDVGDVAPLERHAETGDGILVHPDDAVAASLDAHVRRVVLDRRSVVVDQGTRTRLFHGPGRDAALIGITPCTHPGCDLPARWSQVDHRIEHHDGGLTDQDNADIRCGPHNRYKHRARLTTRRQPDGTTITYRADGTPITAAGRNIPPLPTGTGPPADGDEPPDQPPDQPPLPW
ncbi:MAG: HNH endonuclease signature motif containing protein [Desertimonas sp.]